MEADSIQNALISQLLTNEKNNTFIYEVLTSRMTIKQLTNSGR